MKDVIRAIYAQVDAPAWAAPNLDGLADVLRDLSWRPAGPVELVVPDLSALDDAQANRLLATLWRSADDAAASDRPLRIVGAH